MAYPFTDAVDIYQLLYLVVNFLVLSKAAKFVYITKNYFTLLNVVKRGLSPLYLLI